MRLPMGLLYTNFTDENYTVNKESRLVSVIGWSKAEVGPFRLNLDIIDHISGDFHIEHGRNHFHDNDDLQDLLWETSKTEAGSLTDDEVCCIIARIMSFLCRWDLVWQL
jgi:hypothetical protein